MLKHLARRWSLGGRAHARQGMKRRGCTATSRGYTMTAIGAIARDC